MIHSRKIALVAGARPNFMKVAPFSKTEGRDTLARLGVESGRYATLTLHRPSNVDAPEILAGIIDVLTDLSRELPIIWPLHPRSKKNLESMQLLAKLKSAPGMILTEPLGYLDMLALSRSARMIITDSGGLQEEATVLGVPCITLRDNTERPITVEVGCNQVLGNQPSGIRCAISSVLNRNGREIRTPELWDGKAAERIADAVIRLYS